MISDNENYARISAIVSLLICAALGALLLVETFIPKILFWDKPVMGILHQAISSLFILILSFISITVARNIKIAHKHYVSIPEDVENIKILESKLNKILAMNIEDFNMDTSISSAVPIILSYTHSTNESIKSNSIATIKSINKLKESARRKSNKVRYKNANQLKECYNFMQNIVQLRVSMERYRDTV